MKENILIDPLDLAQVIVYIMTIIFENTIHTIQDVKNVCISLYGSPQVDFRGNVYILNFPNDKKYCGQTINYEIRMRQYNAKKQHTILLQRAMDKHTFESLIIDRLEIPLCMMDTLEIFFIHYYNLTNPKYGYNGNSGGHRRYTRSEDTKKRHSASMMGNTNPLGTKRTAETIAKYMAGEKNPMYGRKGKLAPGSKRIIVFGSVYETAKEVGDVFAAKLSLGPQCITGWIRDKRYTNEVFYITEKFYDCVIENEVKHITKDFYEYIIDNEITYFTNELYTIWSVFERFCVPFVEMRKPKQTNRHHGAKPVVAFGKAYTTGQIAADTLRETYKQKSKQFIVEWISHGRYPNDVFKITPEFYDYVIDNNITDISKSFYQQWTQM